MAKGLIIKVPSARDRVVVTRRGKDLTVVAHGRSLKAVLARARKAGVDDPVIFFVPDPRVRHVY